MLALATSLLFTAAPDTVARDTTASPHRVVRRLAEIVVRASPIGDPLSSQTTHPITRESLRTLPVDRLADALALQAGVVATGEVLHVRGGRAGDFQTLVGGIPLDEPLRGRPMELPLLAVESAELIDGVLDSRLGGAFAGVAQIRTVNPGPRPEAEARWEGDGGIGNDFTRRTGFQRYAARVSGPLRGGLGAVAGADVLSDDTWLPALRPRERLSAWRADNRLLGFFKLTAGAPLALEMFASRRVERPFNPMWSLDGYTIPQTGTFGTEGPAFSSTPQPGYSRYRAADHQAMTDESRLAVVLSWRTAMAAGRLQAAAGWTDARRLTSVGGRDDESYLDATRTPIFGLPESNTSDPFFVYQGDEPFFQKSRARTLSLRSDFDRPFSSGSRYGLGAGLEYDQVEMRELDFSALDLHRDSLRAFEAFAPGGFAYAQGRWVREGMVLNGGLRIEGFTAGPQAVRQAFGRPAGWLWTLSPRLGVAYPVSTRDVLSVSYGRIHQSPARDYLYDNRTLITQRQPLGNPGLVPATVISYEVALRHLLEGGAVQLSVFYRDLFGQIGTRQFRSGFFSMPRYENADEGNAQGFELSWFGAEGRDSRLEVHYSFLHAVGTQSLEEGIPQGSLIVPRAAPFGNHPLDWDRRHSLAIAGTWRRPSIAPTSAPRGPIELVFRSLRGALSASWATRVGSGLPWTASPRRAAMEDWSLLNRRRFGWEEETSLGLRWAPAHARGRLAFGIEVRNLFDSRSDRAATLSGFPHPVINTYYDDYGAFRGETGLGGGAYWDARDATVPNAWVRVFDPRLSHPPRRLRFRVEGSW